jgi:hypothetical protein
MQFASHQKIGLQFAEYFSVNFPAKILRSFKCLVSGGNYLSSRSARHLQGEFCREPHGGKQPCGLFTPLSMTTADGDKRGQTSNLKLMQGLKI